jgi:hypothetical protein
MTRMAVVFRRKSNKDTYVNSPGRYTEVTFESEALFALRGHCGLRRGQGLPPLCVPFSASGILPSLRFGEVSLDEAGHFLHNRGASVAIFRWCSGSIPESHSDSCRI